ncbi:Protein of unknown function [Litoreibacter ascidiaceicola]|uniref:YetF C-terminal domain-containing protein n=1 Tax=Litoreibacter ascidiaceicola TaxID=1486859 RepID=A0A1M4TSE6_9RHOB|nr:YetF domain-containing protein [Litoreibacter ascidiaceicola]SHE47338.1 Protein of unknown function [Litoreibacter ascidiaceicola]
MSTTLELLMRAAISIVVIVALVRINGLRSFSKMAGFDFALTVAIGSILAFIMTSTSTPVWIGPVALVFLFALRHALARLRERFGWGDALDNPPVFLMYDGEILEANLQRTRVTRAELIGKLREANALELSKVRAVILETTGDVSVLHGDAVDDLLLEDVSWGDVPARN